VEAAPPLGSPSWARSKLGVSRSANAVEIKKAFRVVALATHPDRGGDERAFIEAQRAFEVAVANAERPRKKKR
jgi:DnaJ-class molecular chaperone